jgi:predicted RNA binding protein YcfA (HicA-like mRNA interferase family)
MKVRDVIKMIEEDGWYYRRTRGSHRDFNIRSNLAWSRCPAIG